MWCHLDDVSLYYEVVGEGRPILFLHGWTMDHRCEAAEFEPILSQRPGWQRVYLDLPGMGQSSVAEGVTNQDQMLEVVLRFVDKVFAGRRFVVAGNSAGAYLARGVVYRRAAQMDGLLLRLAVIVPDNAKRTLPLFRPLVADPDVVAALTPGDKEVVGDVLIQRPEYIAAQRDKMLTSIHPAQQQAKMAFLDIIRTDPTRYAFTFDVDRLPAPFDAPTLILAGRQDVVVGYRDAWAIVENYPRATFAAVDRADHGYPVDRDRLFHALVHDWLDRIEEAFP